MHACMHACMYVCMYVCMCALRVRNFGGTKRYDLLPDQDRAAKDSGRTNWKGAEAAEHAVDHSTFFETSGALHSNCSAF